MELHELAPIAGSTQVGKRKGRGTGTGNGKTAGRGHKGQKARSGGKIRVGFEGGQMPLARRIPKRGFNNIFAKPLTAVNLGQLNVFEDGAVVDAAALTEKGIIRDCKYGLKVLSNGNLTKKLTVKAAAFSGSAKTKIEEAGGKAEVVSVLTTIRNAWKIPELRRKLLFTLVIILLYRIGNVIPVPGVNVQQMSLMFSQQLSNTIFGLFDMMSGSAFSQATIFALSIQPYINASIIIQLLTIAIPALERLSKEGGEEGKKMITKITRYTTVGLGVLMGFAYYIMLSNYNSQYSNMLLTSTGFLTALVIILTFTAGSTLVMWLGDQISEHGIGNGISMILFANIIARIPSGIILPIFNNLKSNFGGFWYWALLLIVAMLAIIVFIVFVSQAERRIPVQYAKRVVGRKVYGGQNTHLPIKVNMSGVMPIIFAQSIASLPATICAFGGWTSNWAYKHVFTSTSVIYTIIYLLLIVGFSYFYATIQYNPVEVANNLKKNGGFIPGFRPGRPTADFIRKVINKITLFGAIYLGVIAVLPVLLGTIMSNTRFSFGGTSIIIVVSVALETVAAIEAQMLMRNYSGFLEK